MPIISWKVDLDGQPYDIELDHGMFSGNSVIRVNSLKLDEASKSTNKIKSELPFQLGTHDCKIVITMFMGITYDFSIDGKSEGSQKITQWQIIKAIPLWAWLFSIPLGFMCLGGMDAAYSYTKPNVNLLGIVILVGYFGFLMTVLVYASDKTCSLWKRVLICITLTIGYGIFILFSGCSCIGLVRIH